MEANVWSDPAVLEKLRNDFIIVALYTDDRTKLPENEWYTSDNDGKVKKTIGRVNEDYQISKFGTNAIPLYAVVDHEGNLLTEDHYGYDPDISEFLNYLEEGKNKF
jgi:thiol:disulfide interchange protein DsbD